MDMAEDGTPKKVSSLPENIDATSEDLIAMWKQAEEANSMMNMMGTLVSIEPISIEPREYMSQNKSTLASKVKATLKKVAGKILHKAPRKKRTTLDPIVGAVLKFHKDDDVDPADAGTASCRS